MAEINDFDAPIPGQSLTDKPGNAPWEHPPQFTDTAEAAEYIWDKLTHPDYVKQVIAMLDAGIPVEALCRVIIFAGFTEGKWTPDVGFMLAEVVIKMIATIAVKSGVKKFKISMQDLTNNREMQSIMDIGSKEKEFKKASEGVQKDIEPKPTQRGLMAAPPPKEEEVA
tara:strand:+ start:620 stop:1123 length:504 start_codon:yes stop_codon:yes gene_type:complete